MELLRLLPVVILAVMVVGTILFFGAASFVNDEIDRCDDSSSGKYIRDAARRAVECPTRLPLPVSVGP